MPCAICQECEEEIQHAWRFHVQILKVLKASTPTASDDYQNIKALEDNARLDLEAAERRLKKHEREHAVLQSGKP